MGDGHCPFKDFLSARTFRLLRDTVNVRVEVRTGLYDMSPAGEGLDVRGAGTSEIERTVLTAYQGESVVLDGGMTLREVIRVSGSYNLIAGITIQNAGAHNIEFRGGHHHVVEDSVIGPNLSSDSLKGDAGASAVVIRRNEFFGWGSQAIDMTGVSDWTIEGNTFHDAQTPGRQAIGVKFGSRDVTIRDNRLSNTGGFSLGGTSTSHPDDAEAYRIVAEGNTLENITGNAFKLYSCVDCQIRNNRVASVQDDPMSGNTNGGLVLGGEDFEGPSGCSGGCRPTSGLRVTGNTLRGITGMPPDVYWIAFPTETAGLTAEVNVYCTEPGQQGRFVYDSTVLDHAAWVQAARTDETSSAVTTADPRCF